MAGKERVFNNRKRKVFRKRIPAREVASSLLLILVLIAAGLWFATRKHVFDASERDIATTILAASSVEDRLYRTPLERWIDPESAAATPGAPAAQDLGIFPASILEGGWQPSSRLQEFNPDTLYEKINGAAEQYIQFGFQKLHYIAVAKPDSGADISIELYDMGEFQNALGIFAAQRGEGQATVKAGPANYYPTEAGAVGLFGRYYAKLVGNESSSAIQEKAAQLVGQIAALAQSGQDTPKPYLMFSDLLGLPFDAIAYERTDVFQYGFAKDFWFGTRPDAPDSRYYIHEAASEEEADTLYSQLLENHKFDYTVVKEREQDVVLKHNFLNTFLTLSRRGTLILGVDNAADQNAANQGMSALLGVLDATEES